MAPVNKVLKSMNSPAIMRSRRRTGTGELDPVWCPEGMGYEWLWLILEELEFQVKDWSESMRTPLKVGLPAEVGVRCSL